MKTGDLIDMLASGPDLAITARPTRAAVAPLLGSVLASSAIMLAMLGLRAHLGEAAMQFNLWIKLLFSLALAWAGYIAARRLSVPGARIATLPAHLAAPVLLIWGLAAMALMEADPEDRLGLFLGNTWRYCPALITLMSLPIFAATLRVMRSRAPTHLRLAGAAAGFAAGAAAAAVYCLHCPETSVVFVGFWYLLGMLVPAGLGAMIGPRVLAW